MNICIYILWIFVVLTLSNFCSLEKLSKFKSFFLFFLDTHKPKTLLPLPCQVENIHVKPKEKIALPTWRHFSEHGGLFLWVFVA